MTTATATNILRIPALSQKIGLSRSAIYERLDPKCPRHDPTFPKPIPLGLKAIGFLEAEVDRWIASQADKRRQAG